MNTTSSGPAPEEPALPDPVLPEPAPSVDLPSEALPADPTQSETPSDPSTPEPTMTTDRTPSTDHTTSTEPDRGAEPAGTTLTVEPTSTPADAVPAWGTPVGHGPVLVAGGAHEAGPVYGPTYGPGHDAGHAAYGQPRGSLPGPGTGPSAGPTGPTFDPAPDQTPGQDFFHAIRRLGLARDESARWVGGVCAGLAGRWGISPLAVRLLFVLSGLLFGVGLFLYGLLWMFLPQQDGRIHGQQLLRGTLSAGFVGALVAMLAGAPFGFATDGGRGVVPILLVAGVVYLIVRRHRASAGR